MNRGGLLLAALAAVITCAAACTGGGEPGVARLSYKESHGLCARACLSELSLDAGGAGRLVIRDQDGTIAVDRTIELAPADAERLFQLAAAAAASPWDATYGCPNCVDQGSFDLAFDDRATHRETVIDPSDHPAKFDDLLTALHDLVAAESFTPDAKRAP